MARLIGPEHRPHLARRVRLRFDRREQAHVLLWPERGLVLNRTASAILLRCDGDRTVSQIAEQLSGEIDRALVTEDVLELLEGLRLRRLIELGDAP
jgi:pyrroloquinoline quinone biosynthesis protein D